MFTDVYTTSVVHVYKSFTINYNAWFLLTVIFQRVLVDLEIFYEQSNQQEVKISTNW